jgi:hypothetical protein
MKIFCLILLFLAFGHSEVFHQEELIDNDNSYFIVYGGEYDDVDDATINMNFTNVTPYNLTFVFCDVKGEVETEFEQLLFAGQREEMIFGPSLPYIFEASGKCYYYLEEFNTVIELIFYHNVKWKQEYYGMTTDDRYGVWIKIVSPGVVNLMIIVVE